MKKYLPGLLLSLPLTALLFTTIVPSYAAHKEESFLPTWKLLNTEQKQQFIAGYLHGWKDAGAVTQVLLEHIEKHPDEAVKSLQTVQSLYDMSSERPSLLAKGVDEFYSDPDNAQSALSKAITASRTY